MQSRRGPVALRPGALWRCGLRLRGGANPAARNWGNYRGTAALCALCDLYFRMGSIATFLSILDLCASPFDQLPSPKVEETECGANYPKANYPPPAAPAGRSKHSLQPRSPCLSVAPMAVLPRSATLHLPSFLLQPLSVALQPPRRPGRSIGPSA